MNVMKNFKMKIKFFNFTSIFCKDIIYLTNSMFPDRLA